jgi:hypothetical protein
MSQLSSSRCASFAVIAFRDTGVVTLGGVTCLRPLQPDPTANNQPKPIGERQADCRKTSDNDRCC